MAMSANLKADLLAAWVGACRSGSSPVEAATRILNGKVTTLDSDRSQHDAMKRVVNYLLGRKIKGTKKTYAEHYGVPIWGSSRVPDSQLMQMVQNRLAQIAELPPPPDAAAEPPPPPDAAAEPPATAAEPPPSRKRNR